MVPIKNVLEHKKKFSHLRFSGVGGWVVPKTQHMQTETILDNEKVKLLN